jgi:signal transduction histidine kinase
MAAVIDDFQRHAAGGEIDTVRALLHDLRQPLAAILLLAGTDGGDVSRKLHGITDQARWLADLVEAALVDASNDDVVSTDVAALVHHTVDLARTTAACELRVEVLEDGRAWARPVALSRALGCVVDNAVRAAGAGGHVLVEVSTEPDGVHVRVVDDGPGLGRVAARTSLGLTTVRAMVAACHGSFELMSRASGGAVADIRLAESRLKAVAS